MSKQTRPTADDATPAQEPPLPALDAGDEDPDSMAGDLTYPDVDLSHLEVAPDEDGGNVDE